MEGDDPTSAGNQQERPITPDWVVGFVDGEGCFSVSVVRQAGRPSRRGYRTGWQLNPRFAVTQGARSVRVLEDLRQFFGVGKLHRNRRGDNHKEDLYRYDVCRLDELTDVIVPFFQRYQLRTAKRQDFETFSRCLAIMSDRQHLETRGLIIVLELLETMNHRKSREDLIGILRGHTPDVLCDNRMMIWSDLCGDTQGPVHAIAGPASYPTGLTFAQSEIPCRVSSDPHEWRNELDTVSARDSAKLQYL